MNQDRLQIAFDYLCQAPPEQFNYGVTLLELAGCGTTACVAGHTVLCAQHDAAMLSARVDSTELIGAAPGTSELYAAAKWLELSFEEAAFLFLWRCEYATRDHALDRMRWLLVGKTSQAYVESREQKIAEYWAAEEGCPVCGEEDPEGCSCSTFDMETLNAAMNAVDGAAWIESLWPEAADDKDGAGRDERQAFIPPNNPESPDEQQNQPGDV